jgi:palmitoyltransferase
MEVRDGEIPYSIQRLISAVQYGDQNLIISAIRDNHISPNLCDESGCSLLHWASINNRVGIVRYLLGQGADANWVGGTLREIPIQWAARNGRYCQLIRLLVDAGSNLHHKNAHGVDVLHTAVRCGNVHTAFLLLSAGASPNTLDESGETPLHYLLKGSVNMSATDLIRLLLRFQADVFIKDFGP